MAGVVVSLAVCLLGLLVVYRCLAAWGLRAPGGLARPCRGGRPSRRPGLAAWLEDFPPGRWLPGGTAPGGDGGGYAPLGRGPHLGGGFPAAPALGRRPLHPPDRGGLPGLHGKRPAPVSGVLPGVRVGGPAAAAGDSLHRPGQGRPSPACATAAPAATSTAWPGRPTTAGWPGTRCCTCPWSPSPFSPAW